MRRPTLTAFTGPLRRAFSWAKGAALEALFFAGLALAAAGVALAYLPAGLVAAGAAVTACAYLEMRQ